MKILSASSHPALFTTAARPPCNSKSAFAAVLGCIVALVSSVPLHAGPGKVLPPNAHPHGYTLEDVAAEVADFTINGNDPALYPDIPFQIIYRGGNNTFTVETGTPLYVKSFFADDTDPVIGDFPENEEDAVEYIFGTSQLGAHDLEIEVDGNVSSLDRPGYVGGPVPCTTADGATHHIVQIAAFVSPLKKGTHTITIRGVLDGDAILDLIGEAYVFSATYTVIVE